MLVYYYSKSVPTDFQNIQVDSLSTKIFFNGQIMIVHKGDLYNLSELHMGNHNGTHIDAPLHFINYGKTINDIDKIGPLVLQYFIRERRITKFFWRLTYENE